VGGVLFTFSEISWRNNQKDLFEKQIWEKH
jgi:hypothetical protein